MAGLNEDGDFNDAGEQIFTSVEVAAGSNTLSHFVPDNVPAGYKFARFRISPLDTNGQCVGTTVLPTGLVVGGEVEDYRFNLLDPTAVSLSALETADSQSTIVVAATFVLMLIGTAMLVRTRRD